MIDQLLSNFPSNFENVAIVKAYFLADTVKKGVGRCTKNWYRNFDVTLLDGAQITYYYTVTYVLIAVAANLVSLFIYWSLMNSDLFYLKQLLYFLLHMSFL